MSSQSTRKKIVKRTRKPIKTSSSRRASSFSSQRRSSLKSVNKIASVDEYLEQEQESQRRRRPPNPISILFWSLVRLLILGVGLGTIAGTVLANIDVGPIDVSQFTAQLPFSHSKDKDSPTDSSQTQTSLEVQSPSKTSSTLTLNQELLPLKQKFEKLAAKYPKLQPGAFFVDLDNGAYANFGGDITFPAASTIKIPILVALLEDVDKGKVYLDEMLTIKPELIAEGSGDMQYQTPGKQFSTLETATKMIVISDNTATNMLIERLGGADVLNQRFQKWGLKTTVIHNPLPDLEGTNTTSPQDLSELLAKVSQGELISVRSRDRLLGIMRETKTRTLLPQGLEKDAIISHKTGDIGSVLGDAGIIDMPTGKRYIGAVMVKRPYNDLDGRTLIQAFSRTAYQHFKWYEPRPLAQKAEEEILESQADKP